MEISPTGSFSVQQTADTGRSEGVTRRLLALVQSLGSAEYFGPDRTLVVATDSGTGRHVVQVLDRQTDEVIDQFPPEYILRIAANLARSARAASNHTE